jgi:hypothetical protein
MAPGPAVWRFSPLEPALPHRPVEPLGAVVADTPELRPPRIHRAASLRRTLTALERAPERIVDFKV